MNGFWVAATAMAFITFAVHTFVGTRFAVPPLRSAHAHVPKATIWLNYLCWHIVTVALLLLAFSFLSVVLGLLNRDVIMVATACFAGVGGVSLVATAKGRIPWYRFPASYLGATTALLGAAGFLA
jgi:hypothetical protein